MSIMKSARILGIIISIGLCLLTNSGQASSRPFKAPAGTQVTSQVNRDYAVWTIMAPDGPIAAVAKIKLPRQYWNGKAFQRYINSYYKKDRTFAAYGIKLKTSWKNGAYVISGTSGGYRVYGKGRLGKKGEWLYGYVVGQQSSSYTAALERMVKGLK